MKIIAWEYRSVGSSGHPLTPGIGFVLEQNSMDEVSCRVGIWIGGEFDGEELSVRFIAEMGGKMFQEEAIAIFPKHKELIISNWKV
jgi:hypothetical protein